LAKNKFFNFSKWFKCSLFCAKAFTFCKVQLIPKNFASNSSMRVLKTQIYRLFQIVDFKNANIKLLYSCTFFKGFLSVIFYKEQSFKPLTDLFKTWNKEREGYLAISLSYDLYPP
jgi:hypothetical protein